jgi:hypothetical protein
MRFVLKQLRFGFPFVFPMRIDDGIGGASYVVAEIKKREREEFLFLKKQVEELTARVQALEDERVVWRKRASEAIKITEHTDSL